MKTLQPTELDKIRQELINLKVKYIEVIEELTDHIANGIEMQYRESRNQITFEEALAIELNTIGKETLKKIQSDTYIAKSKEYILVLANSLKDCFSSIKLIVITAIFVSIYAMLSVSTYSPFINSAVKLILTATFAIGNGILVYNSIKTYVKNQNKLLLNEVYVITVCLISVSTYLFFFHIDLTSLISYQYSFINLGYLAKSGIYTFIMVLQYSVFYLLKPKYTKEESTLTKFYSI